MNLTYRSTPNKSHRSAVIKPIYLVLHQTVGAYQGSCSWLANPAAQASAEEVISRDGQNVCVLIRTDEDCYSWSVGNGNPYVAASIEGEWIDASTPFLPGFYQTLAARLQLRSKQAKAKYGVDIPMRFSRFKGDPGIATHGQIAEWYGGSDHYTCGTAYNKNAVLAAINPVIHHEVNVKTGSGKVYHLKGKHLAKRTGALIVNLMKAGKDKFTIKRKVV